MTLPTRIILSLYCFCVTVACLWVPWSYHGLGRARSMTAPLRYGLTFRGAPFSQPTDIVYYVGYIDYPRIGLELLAITGVAACLWLSLPWLSRVPVRNLLKGLLWSVLGLVVVIYWGISAGGWEYVHQLRKDA